MDKYSITCEGAEWLLWREGSCEAAQRFQNRREALRAGMTLAHRNGSRLLLNPAAQPRRRRRPSAL